MSKAMAWAAREHRRAGALEEALARIEAEMNTPSPDNAPVFLRADGNQLAYVSRFDAQPRLAVRGGYNGISSLTADEALALARWINDTFGDEPAKDATP